MSKRFSPLDLAKLFLALVPCAPGLIFLLAGVIRDPVWRRSSLPPAARDLASWQAHQLYLVGGLILLVGTLGMAVVLWKLAHPPPPDDEEEVQR